MTDTNPGNFFALNEDGSSIDLGLIPRSQALAFMLQMMEAQGWTGISFDERGLMLRSKNPISSGEFECNHEDHGHDDVNSMEPRHMVCIRRIPGPMTRMGAFPMCFKRTEEGRNFCPEHIGDEVKTGG